MAGDGAVLVTGGTGRLGRLVVPRLSQHARGTVRVLSRRPREPVDGVDMVVGDLRSGDGVAAALDGVATVVHLAGDDRGDEVLARNLVRLAAAAGISHLLNISVVGADRVPVVGRLDRAIFGYFASQREAEHVVATSGIAWTNLRATQFHDLLLTIVRYLTRRPVVAVPSRLLLQPIDKLVVAERIVMLALGPPAGRVPDIAGPRVYRMDQLVRSYLHAARRRAVLVPLFVPGRAARAFRAGAALAPRHAAGGRTWEDFLSREFRTAPATHAVTRRDGRCQSR